MFLADVLFSCPAFPGFPVHTVLHISPDASVEFRQAEMRGTRRYPVNNAHTDMVGPSREKEKLPGSKQLFGIPDAQNIDGNLAIAGNLERTLIE